MFCICPGIPTSGSGGCGIAYLLVSLPCLSSTAEQCEKKFYNETPAQKKLRCHSHWFKQGRVRVSGFKGFLGGSWVLITTIIRLLIAYLEDLGDFEGLISTAWGFKYPEPPRSGCPAAGGGGASDA